MILIFRDLSGKFHKTVFLTLCYYDHITNDRSEAQKVKNSVQGHTVTDGARI